MSPLGSQVLINELGLFYFVGYALVMLPIYYGNFPVFEKYKISDKPWAWRSEKKEVRDAFWALAFRSVYLFVFNYCVLVPVLTVGKFYLQGDVMSFSTSDWPTLPALLRDNVILTLVHEFGFYWSHRLAHHPKLYKYHKVHHEYKQNTVLASQHEHPIDYVVTIATPALLAVSAVKPHSLTIFIWIGWIVMTNIDGETDAYMLKAICFSPFFHLHALHSNTTNNNNRSRRLRVPMVARSLVLGCGFD
jgi:methylsterol monooxygenase